MYVIILSCYWKCAILYLGVDNHMATDMTFAYIEGNFMPTEVGSAGC